MSLPGPSPQDERWLAVANRYPSLHDAAEARAGGWKTPSLLSRVLMFVLGLFAAGLIGGSLLFVPGHWLVAGIAMVAAGEWLIRSRRLVQGGIEEAMILCGAIAIVAELLVQISGVGDAMSAVLLSLAVLAAGLRLRNPWFTTVAAIGLSMALAFAGEGKAFGSRSHTVLAMAFCIVVAIGALVAGARRWERPSDDRRLDGLVIAMPIAAQGWALAEWSAPLRLSSLGPDGSGALVPAVLALAFAIVLALTGLRRRTHAPLVGALIQLAFLGWSLRELTGLPLYGRMILWGGVLLALGFALDRGLRRPRAGITSSPLGPRSRLDDLAQVYGAAHVAPATIAPASASDEGHGGNFGGGGASGRF